MAKINLGKVVPEKGVDYFTDSEKAEFKQEIEAEVDSRLDTDEANIATNTSNIATNTTDITALGTRMTTAESNISTNVSNINTLSGKVTTLENDMTTAKSNIQTNAGDINTLEQHQTIQDTTISEIQGEQTIQDNKIEELEEECEALRNDLNEGTLDVSGTGENITLNNTSGARFKKFDIGGNSKQQTRIGKNLLNVPKEWNLTGKQVITVDLPAGNYILTAGEVIKGGATNPACVGLSSSYFSVTSNLVRNITLTEEQSEIEFYSNGYNYNASSGVTSVINNLMIRSADIQDDTYEEYGVMPSPKYPSEIKHVTGDVNITINNNEDTESQIFTFPLGEEKLMLGDYLADDGIHRVRKEVDMGDLNYSYNSANQVFYTQFASTSDMKKVTESGVLFTGFATAFKPAKSVSLANWKNRNNGTVGNYVNATSICFKDSRYTDVEDFKTSVTGQYLEYDLAEPIITPYTPEQQAVYNQIKKTVHSYRGITHISSTNETGFIINTIAIGDLNNLLTRIQILESEV